jgi:hypothetical protein
MRMSKAILSMMIALPIFAVSALAQQQGAIDINFTHPGFSATVFYDNIRVPDGIVVKSNNSLKVVNEFGPDGPFVLLARRGGTYTTDDAISTIGWPFVSPDDLEAGQKKQLFIADGQAQTVFKLPQNGGTPVPFVTTTTTGSDLFNPFGVEIAPPGFYGPNVEPGDLIVADNAYSDPNQQAVWAINQKTGAVKILAQGTVFEGGPLRAEFGPDGTLYVFENVGFLTGMSRIATVAADGTVSPYVEYIPGRPALAVHPKTGDVYFVYNHDDGVLYRLASDGGSPELFASNLGRFQSLEFSRNGLSLFVGATERHQVIEIRGNRQAWGFSDEE